MIRTYVAVVLSALVGLQAMPVAAQNPIAQGGWEGFAMRRPDGRFDRCVLYNRTIKMLNASPYGMFGITRDGAGNVGLMIFFEPRSLTRQARMPVRMLIGDAPPLSLDGDAVSDFHVVVRGPLDGHVIANLREASAIEFSVGSKTVRFEVKEIGAVLDRLRYCVDDNAR